MLLRIRRLVAEAGKLGQKLFDHFAQTMSPRWTLDGHDLASILRVVIMAGTTAGLAEIARRVNDLSYQDSWWVYIVMAVLLQTLRKWAGTIPQ